MNKDKALVGISSSISALRNEIWDVERSIHEKKRTVKRLEAIIKTLTAIKENYGKSEASLIIEGVRDEQ